MCDPSLNAFMCSHAVIAKDNPLFLRSAGLQGKEARGLGGACLLL